MRAFYGSSIAPPSQFRRCSGGWLRGSAEPVQPGSGRKHQNNQPRSASQCCTFAPARTRRQFRGARLRRRLITARPAGEYSFPNETRPYSLHYSLCTWAIARLAYGATRLSLLFPRIGHEPCKRTTGRYLCRRQSKTPSHPPPPGSLGRRHLVRQRRTNYSFGKTEWSLARLLGAMAPAPLRKRTRSVPVWAGHPRVLCGRWTVLCTQVSHAVNAAPIESDGVGPQWRSNYCCSRQTGH